MTNQDILCAGFQVLGALEIPLRRSRKRAFWLNGFKYYVGPRSIRCGLTVGASQPIGPALYWKVQNAGKHALERTARARLGNVSIFAD